MKLDVKFIKTIFPSHFRRILNKKKNKILWSLKSFIGVDCELGHDIFSVSEKLM